MNTDIQRPAGFGLACTVAWTELHAAILSDGRDFKDGKCGPAVRAWIEGVVVDAFGAADAGSPASEPVVQALKGCLDAMRRSDGELDQDNPCTDVEWDAAIAGAEAALDGAAGSHGELCQAPAEPQGATGA